MNANMPRNLLSALICILRSKSLLVGCLKYCDSKTTLTAFTNLFILSMAVDSSILQYSSVASTATQYASMRSAIVHFWIDNKPNNPEASFFRKRRRRIMLTYFIHDSKKKNRVAFLNKVKIIDQSILAPPQSSLEKSVRACVPDCASHSWISPP